MIQKSTHLLASLRVLELEGVLVRNRAAVEDIDDVTRQASVAHQHRAVPGVFVFSNSNQHLLVNVERTSIQTLCNVSECDGLSIKDASYLCLL